MKIRLLVGFLCISILLGLSTITKARSNRANLLTAVISPTKTGTLVKSFSSLFVPYWSMSQELLPNEYDRIIYFGISANRQGIDENDQGYRQLQRFNQQVLGKTEKYLTLRMLNTDDNLAILESPDIQNKIIYETIGIAKDDNFQGIVLDLELSALPFEETTRQINSFIAKLSQETKRNQLKLAVAMYGDVFYRERPYDVRTISQNADEMMIMAYDLHKPYGEPGPNFPLMGKEQYDYDLETMINDYLQVVPKEKLNVIFGMYGYDWTLGPENKPLKNAAAVTSSQLTKICQQIDCFQKRDQTTSENLINYQDKESQPHVVWMVDEPSVQEKEKYLETQGIEKIGYWAWGYF